MRLTAVFDSRVQPTAAVDGAVRAPARSLSVTRTGSQTARRSEQSDGEGAWSECRAWRPDRPQVGDRLADGAHRVRRKQVLPRPVSAGVKVGENAVLRPAISAISHSHKGVSRIFRWGARPKDCRPRAGVGFLGREQQPPPHQLGVWGSGERCKLPRHGRVLPSKGFPTIFNTQDGLSWH